MSEISWSTRSIRECLIESFAGEWGAEPLPGNARVLRATDIDDEGHVIGSGALRRLPIGKLTSRQLEDGDILLEGSGGGPDKPVGRVAFFDAAEHQGPAVCSNFFKTLRPERSVVDPRFLWRKLMWFYRQPTLLTFQQQTTGIINLKFEEYLNAAIEVPADLAEQRAIAQILDTLDTAIRETESLIDKLKAVKQGLLHDLLTRGIDANGELRPPQSEAPQLYKDSPLGWIPREWEVKRLDEYCMLVADGTHDSPKPAEKGYPLVTSKNLRDGQLDLSGSYLISEIDYHAVRVRSMVEAGDILFGMIGTIGNPVIIEEGQDQIATKNIGLLRLNGDFCKGRFLKDWLSSSAVERQLNEAMSGSTQRFIGLGTLRAILVAEPSAFEMEKIVDTLKNLTARMDADRQLLLKLTREKAGLMDDLLTGRVRVTPPLESVQQPVAQTGA